jgi:hypothetical protein
MTKRNDTKGVHPIYSKTYYTAFSFAREYKKWVNVFRDLRIVNSAAVVVY